MDGVYPWIVFIHVAAVLMFFILHGASMAVAFRLKADRERPERVRALLDVSAGSLVPSFVIVAIGLLAGIAVGFMGDWWGQLWIWTSLGIFLVVAFAMTPMASIRLGAIRAAAGQPARGRSSDGAPREDATEMARLIDAWNPMPSAVIGISAFVVILWLMFFKPF